MLGLGMFLGEDEAVRLGRKGVTAGEVEEEILGMFKAEEEARVDSLGLLLPKVTVVFLRKVTSSGLAAAGLLGMVWPPRDMWEEGLGVGLGLMTGAAGLGAMGMFLRSLTCCRSLPLLLLSLNCCCCCMTLGGCCGCIALLLLMLLLGCCMTLPALLESLTVTVVA